MHKDVSKQKMLITLRDPKNYPSPQYFFVPIQQRIQLKALILSQMKSENTQLAVALRYIAPDE